MLLWFVLRKMQRKRRDSSQILLHEKAKEKEPDSGINQLHEIGANENRGNIDCTRIHEAPNTPYRDAPVELDSTG